MNHARLMFVLLAACSGDDDDEAGEPLIQSTLTARFDGQEFVPKYGFGRIELRGSGSGEQVPYFVMYVGTTKITCAVTIWDDVHEGMFGTASMRAPPMLGPATAYIAISEVVDGAASTNGSMGSVELTAITETDVSAVFSFDQILGGGHYTLDGAVTMLRCP